MDLPSSVHDRTTDEKEPQKKKFWHYGSRYFSDQHPSSVHERTTDEREPHTALSQIGGSFGTNGWT